MSERIVIEPAQVQAHYVREIWRYRELLFFLAWRDILVRYKQTVIGVVWALLRPLVMMVVLTIVFGRLAGLPSRGVPYPLLVFAALLPWQLFASAFAGSSGSLVGNAHLISKVYFPRMIIPASSLLSNVVDFAIAAGMLSLAMLWYQYRPPWQVVFLPAFVGLALLAAIGTGLWLGALNVKYRDVRYLIPFTVQIGLYISPVGFSSAAVPASWRLVYSLNPMVGVIDGFRWALLGINDIYWPGLFVSVVLVAGFVVSGAWYFRATERTFADVI